MRITIVDRHTFMVMEVIEGIPADVADMLDYLANTYSHASYAWFVTRYGSQPDHARHNGIGQLWQNGNISKGWTHD